MNDGFLIITNNTLVKEKLGENYHVEYEDLSYEECKKIIAEQQSKGSTAKKTTRRSRKS